MTNEGRSNKQPEFDEMLACSYIGKYILVGLTYVDHEGVEIERKQLHGVVMSADRRLGLSVQLHGAHEGETLTMPPDLRSVGQAKPGVYTLHSTGEEIDNPDLLATWIIGRPSPDTSSKSSSSGTFDVP
ncbi:MAG: hypothetical protein ACYC1U_08095 [Candidatus Aquicultorales bacterium]